MKDEYIQHHGFITHIDDPEGLGRVKLHIPAIDGNNPDQETIWVNILKSPEGFGADNPSPPQIGASVMVQVSKTNPSLRQVSSIVASRKGKPNPNMPGNISLALKLRKKFEEIQNKNISGRPIMKQVIEQLDRGSDKTKPPVKQAQATFEPTIQDRSGIQTIIPSLESMIQKAPPVKNVSTARQEDSSIFTAAMGNALPGQLFSLGNIFDHLTGDILKEAEAAVGSDVMTALKSVAGTSAQFTPAQVDGFLQQTIRVNPATFANNMLQELKTVKTARDLQDFLQVITTDAVTDLSSMDSVTLQANNAFGALSMTMSPNGEVSEQANEVIELLQSILSQFFGGIPTQGGESQFMPGSKIPDTLLKRMPAEMASQYKEFLEKVGGQNNPPRVSVENTLTSLKNRLS